MYIDYDKTQEVLHGKFDVKVYKETFVNYLEVVISPDGVVEYAVPSHCEKLTKIAMEMSGHSRSELMQVIPELMFDTINALTKYTKYISVWDNYICGNPNTCQIATLKMLKINGVYHGPLNGGANYEI